MAPYKNVVAGLGEIGNPILQLTSKAGPTIGYDINESLVNKIKLKKYEKDSQTLGKDVHHRRGLVAIHLFSFRSPDWDDEF